MDKKNKRSKILRWKGKKVTMIGQNYTTANGTGYFNVHSANEFQKSKDPGVAHDVKDDCFYVDGEDTGFRVKDGCLYDGGADTGYRVKDGYLYMDGVNTGRRVVISGVEEIDSLKGNDGSSQDYDG